MNAAAHLARLGHETYMASAVGEDFLGNELLRRMKKWGVHVRFVESDHDHSTGVVMADIDAAGKASYNILENAAWDHIPCPHDLVDCAHASEAILYGTLAQRGESNLVYIKHLLKTAPKSHRIFDVNLRAPFDDLVLADQLACLATVIKLNDEEAARLCNGPLHDCETMARKLSDRWPVASICITAGSHGAGIWHDDVWTWEHARPVEVADTVGAGDAFVAGLADGLIRALPMDLTLRRASRLAEFVASCEGATPEYNEQIKKEINHHA